MSEDRYDSIAEDLVKIIEHLRPEHTEITATVANQLSDDGRDRLRELVAGLGKTDPESANATEGDDVGLPALMRVMDSGGHGFWFWRLDSGRAQFSPGWAQRFGLEADGTDGIDALIAAAHPDHRAGLERAFDQHVSGEHARMQIDIRARNAAGQWRWLRLRAASERDSDRKPTLVAGTVRDVTAERTTDRDSGFLNPTGFREAIETITSGSNHAMVLLLKPRCNDKYLDQLASDARARARFEVVRRLTGAMPPDAAIGEFSDNIFGLCFPARISNEKVLGRTAARILRAVRGVDDVLVADFLLDADLGGVAGDRNLSKNADDLVELALRSLRDNSNSTDPATINLYRRANSIAGSASATVQTIQRALAEDRFIPHFQPIVAHPQGTWVGFEALVRLRDPIRGLLSPAAFLPTAERSDLIVEIGEVILSKALGAMARARAEGKLPGKIAVSVNISGRQLCDARLPNVIDRALECAGLPATCLRLELTETTVVSNLNFACLTLNSLRKRGIRIVLDDFGAGFSSLSYLHELPIDVLKVDRSFVRNVHNNQTRLAILGAMVSMAKSINIPIVAEGIETEGEANVLHDLGITMCQGYYFGKPGPLDQLLDQGKDKLMGTARPVSVR